MQFSFLSSGIKNKLLVIIFFMTVLNVTAQERKMVQILNAGSLVSDEQFAANAQRLLDSVLIRHKNILMWCDSAYTYTGTNRVDAFGNVHINQDDTLHLYANTVFYDGDISFARAWGNVRLVKKSTTIYTDTLDYDLATNIGYYDDKGKIVDSTTTITSQIGKYFVNNDLFYLYKDVVGVDKDYTLHSDTISYNTKTGRINIYGPTTIQDTSGTLYAENGWYDSNNGEAELIEKPVIKNKTQQISAEYIRYSKENKTGKALKQVRILDEENSTIITGNKAEYNELAKTAIVTDSAVFMNYNEKDTLYLHADTLRTIPDTIEDEKIVLAFYKVRFFRNDLQGICDSLVYFTKDSVIQLHYMPVLWSDVHQLTADLIEMQQFENAPDELRMKHNSFIISQQDSGRFDQIKGKEMIGYVVNSELSRIDVNGNGQTLYYAKEKEEIIGLNRAESSKISIRFKEGKINTISFLKSPEGELKPLENLKDEDKFLKDFLWLEELRPVSKDDIFEWRVPVKKSKTENKKQASAVTNVVD